jgi:23S rRNA (uracil1939-C5)-methyltransferase
VLDGLRFKVSAKSFFQTNTRQAARLYRTVLEFADIGKAQNVYDLYSGTGTIGLFLARHAGSVTCMESVEEAVKDAEENARLNHIENISFLQGEVKELFNNDLFKNHGTPDVVVLDPPRSGIHPDTVKMLLEVRPEKIVYVSCNPATQARDIQGLLPAYRPLRIRPVDMFPHTDHVENVVVLGRMNAEK